MELLLKGNPCINIDKRIFNDSKSYTTIYMFEDNYKLQESLKCDYHYKDRDDDVFFAHGMSFEEYTELGDIKDTVNEQYYLTDSFKQAAFLLYAGCELRMVKGPDYDPTYYFDQDKYLSNALNFLSDFKEASRKNILDAASTQIPTPV